MLASGADVAAFLVLFLWCEELWCLVVFFGAIVPLSEADGVVVSEGAGAGAAGGADGAGLATVPV